MTGTAQLILGGVYSTILSNDPCRVIGFDEQEVFYDAYWSSLNKWTFSNGSWRNSIYYRTRPHIFLQNAEFLREQPLTNDEMKIFRPDLPHRLCRYRELNWTTDQFPDLGEYKEYLKKNLEDFTDEVVLAAPSITLRPFGRKGSTTQLKYFVVSSIDPSGFFRSELLWLAHNLQAPVLKDSLTRGLGIFRSGHEKKLPAYYIAGYLSAADEHNNTNGKN